MIQKFIHRLLLRRHFWRTATFSEVAELYASRMLRILALNMTAAFTSIFLYQNGYSVLFITLLWAGFFFYKFLIALPMAAIIAHVGPKHAILYANLMYIPGLISLAFLPSFGAVVLIPMVIFQATSSMMYQIAYMVNFSKVKSIEHAGKEIAYMNIIEKITTGLSPLLGGVLAFLFGPQIVIVLAALLFVVAAVPLFKSAEQESPRQKLVFTGFPWHLVTRNVAAETARGFDLFTSGTVWSLFTAITIIGIAADNQIYATNGLLSSVILLAALGASYAYGRLIDRRRGRELLLFGTIANSITHLSRPFIATTVGIAGLNIANEAATAGYSMAYTRGSFDSADLSGQRTTYLGLMEALTALGSTLAAGVLALMLCVLPDAHAMEYFFYVAAAVVLLIATARFPLYRR
ncbi:MAG: hypothetical protein ABIP50_01235 [Candidatus Saccharimonadales bacterium]